MVNNFKTFVLLAALTALLIGAGFVMGGRGGLMIALGLTVIMNFAGYWFSDKIALKMSGAREVSVAEAPELHSMVGNLVQRANLPMPRVYVMPTMTPNAFATGRNPQHSAVAVTEGIMQILDRDEMEGVLAHELAHIKNRDILISSIAAMLAGALTQLANMFQWAMIFGMGRGDEDDSPASMAGGIAMMVLAPFAAMLVQMAVSRSREYEADRIGAQICGRPLSLANALLKLERGAQLVPMAANPATAHMYIVNPLRGASLMKLFSTHPATEERVARLRAMAFGQA
jgi:heat shock protein HtpX